MRHASHKLTTLAVTSALVLSGAGAAYACEGRDGAAGTYPGESAGTYPGETSTSNSATAATSSSRAGRRGARRARARARAEAQQ